MARAPATLNTSALLRHADAHELAHTPTAETQEKGFMGEDMFSFQELLCPYPASLLIYLQPSFFYR